MSTAQSGSGLILVDGAQYENVLAWLYEHYPSHQPLPLLFGTPYEPIAEAGPILLDAAIGTPAHRAWWRGADMVDGIWLETSANAEALMLVLQRRLRIHSPDGREFWLRFADAVPMRQAQLSNVQWPDGFWHLIDSVWLHHERTPICAWRNDHPQKDCAPLDSGVFAQATLDWPLLEALSGNDGPTQDVQV